MGSHTLQRKIKLAQELHDGLAFGGDDNYTFIDDEGNVSYVGNATYWDDVPNSLVGKQLSSTAGKVDYNYAESSITFAPGGSIETANDLVVFAQQFPHAAKSASSIYPHIHMEQTMANKVIFTMKYRVQSNGQAKTTDWTTITCNTTDDAVFTYGSGTLNQIIAFDPIDMTNAGISATIQFKMARTDSEVGDVEVTFVDFHAEFDSPGSRSEYVK